MKITIEYESSWRNSFLDGSNNDPLPKNGRKFISSMTNLKKPENYIKREVTLDTVMGLLNRLIGDQRKLYQSRQCENYYFKDIEPLVSFTDKPIVVSQEMTYIRNITGSTDQNSFVGAIRSKHPMLTSDFSQELWGILGLSFDEVCDFIQDKEFSVDKLISLEPVDLIQRAENIDKKIKPVDIDNCVDVLNILGVKFSELITDKQPTPYVEKNGKVKPVRFYSAALYIQLERLLSKYDMTLAVTNAKKIAGFSKRGFNGKRDFMKNFVTGGEKKVWGNPYIHEVFVTGEGKTQNLMSKASGKLELEIDIEPSCAKEIAQLIENAGVSSFYLGKKGLAYVTKIRV